MALPFAAELVHPSRSSLLQLTELVVYFVAISALTPFVLLLPYYAEYHHYAPPDFDITFALAHDYSTSMVGAFCILPIPFLCASDATPSIELPTPDHAAMCPASLSRLEAVPAMCGCISSLLIEERVFYNQLALHTVPIETDFSIQTLASIAKAAVRFTLRSSRTTMDFDRISELNDALSFAQHAVEVVGFEVELAFCRCVCFVHFLFALTLTPYQ